ncbi:hypothetical protein NJT12_11200 [Flavobacterium sp. AC]|uniref:Uncharacterized protein n=1 Tax=Flavobacterium azizsancarii TaxID=2961580 RepID=A0ABT4WC74_9FLAO|nr:hypothetical protein [Flavobacterium azizsancarii]MDA6070184.1 hypothetical protein [Flavobacterium azizsancarii]
MESNLKTENIDLVQLVAKRPAMFSIQNVESFFVFFKGYSIGKSDSIVIDFFESFSNFVHKKHPEKCLKNIDSDRIIRLYSSNDSHSLERVRFLIEEFISESDVYEIKEY